MATKYECDRCYIIGKDNLFIIYNSKGKPLFKICHRCSSNLIYWLLTKNTIKIKDIKNYLKGKAYMLP